MLRLLWLCLIPLMLMGCGSSCASNELEEKLSGEWNYQESEERVARDQFMKRLFSDDPPTMEELAELGLTGQDLMAAQENLRLRLTNPDSQLLVELERDHARALAMRQSIGPLTVDGDRMVLTVGGVDHVSVFVVESEEDGVYQLQTTSSGGKVERTQLIWIDDAHFRIVDPSGETMDFVRP